MTDKSEPFTVWHGLLLAEGTALMIGLIMPLTPAKSGSDRGLPQLILHEPSYLDEVCVYFLLTNVLLLVVSAVIAVCMKLTAHS